MFWTVTVSINNDTADKCHRHQMVSQDKHFQGLRTRLRQVDTHMLRFDWTEGYKLPQKMKMSMEKFAF